MKNKLIICLLVLSFLDSNAQSPWTREKGKTYLQIGFTGLFYNAYVFDGKKIENSDDYSDVTTQVYAEYGLSKNLDIHAILPYKFVSVTDKSSSKTDNLSGIGNISIGLKYKISDKNWKVSSGIVYTSNSIKKDATIGLSTGLNTNAFMPYVTIGSSHNKLYYYFNLGYGYLDNNYSDYVKLTAEIGYELLPKGHLIFVLDSKNVVSKESAFINDATQWPSHLDRQAYQAFGIKANYEIKKDKFGVNFAAFGAAGIDNSPLAPTLNLGVYTKF